MENRNYSLFELTGLTEEAFADVLTKNPRAYMAVKGAVAEKHLEKILEAELENGKIKGFKAATGDFEKDFYVTLNNGLEVAVECKNVEVMKTTRKADVINYLIFLITKKFVSKNELLTLDDWKEILLDNPSGDIATLDESLQLRTSKELKALMSQLPKSLTQSGIPRYAFSSSLLKNQELKLSNTQHFLKQFYPPLSIDFQRTRNSTSSPDEDPKEQRFYRLGEIDVVAACLFSRTLNWEFIFCKAENLPRHKKFHQRYSNRLEINPDFWSNDFTSLTI